MSWPAPSSPRQRPRADDDIERLIGLMRLLAPFSALAGFHQRAAALVRAPASYSRGSIKTSAVSWRQLVFADPVRQMQCTWTPQAAAVRPGDKTS